MRCEDVERLIDEHADRAKLTPIERRAVDGHLAICESCRGAWEAALMLRGYRSLPTPAPEPALIDKCRRLARHAPTLAGRKFSFWAGVGVGGALAAGIVLAVLGLDRTAPVDRVRAVPSLTMLLDETRDVSVEIDSAEPLTGVKVRLVLSGGIGLEGLDGRRELRWETDLDAGVNRLRLPVVALDASGGKMLIEVEHGGKQQGFVVQINVDEEDLARASGFGPTLEAHAEITRKVRDI